MVSDSSRTKDSKLYGAINIHVRTQSACVLALYPPSRIFTRRSRKVSSQWTPLRYSLSKMDVRE